MYNSKAHDIIAAAVGRVVKQKLKGMKVQVELDEFLCFTPVPHLGIAYELEYNPHVPIYRELGDHLSDMDMLDCYTYVDRQKILDTGTLYVFTYHPRTPVGFVVVAASSADEIKDWILENHK